MINEVAVKLIRFGICLTYRCESECAYCNRYLDHLKCPDSDIQLDDLEIGWQRAKEAGLQVEKVRITGGEPLLHPQFVDACRIIGDTWNKDYGGRTLVFTNRKDSLPKTEGWRYRGGSLTGKKIHQPPMISPADLNIKGSCGVDTYCHRQRGCGRLFDAFGFSFCIFAGPLGRLLGIDPYEARPVLKGDPRICQHCVFAAGVKTAFALFAKVRDKQIEYPTRTYRKALERLDNRPISFPRFQERAV